MTRTALLRLAPAAVLALLLAGCSAPEQAANRAPATTEQQASAEDSASGSESASEGSEDGEEPEVALPDTWPAAVPVIDGRIVDAFALPGEPISMWGLRVVPEEPLETAHDTALAIMQAAGFEVAGEADNDLGTLNRNYRSAEYSVFINISTAPGEEGVLYNVQPQS